MDLSVDVSRGLRSSALSMTLLEILKANPDILQGISSSQCELLRHSLGISSVHDLASNPVFLSASEIVAFSRANSITSQGLVPSQLLSSEANNINWANAGELDISLLRFIPEDIAKMLHQAGVETIRDMSCWPPFIAARDILAVHLRKAAPDCEEGVPDALRPQANSLPTEKTYHTTLVLDRVNPFESPRDILSALDIDHETSEDSGYTGIGEGAILTYEQSWYFQGTALGHLLHSISLAPGESTRIAMVEWQRKTTGSQNDSTQQGEVLDNTMTRARAIDEITNAVATEAQSGFSRATSKTNQKSWGVNGAVGGMIPSTPISFGVGGSYASGESETVASGYSSSTGSRNIGAQLGQKILDTTQQAASSSRSRFATTVSECTQGEKETLTTRVLTNYNHMHALTLQYYEVIQLFRSSIRLHNAEKCLFVPFKLPDVSNPAIVEKYRGILAASALKDTIRNILLQESTTRLSAGMKPAQFYTERGLQEAQRWLQEARNATGLLIAASPMDDWTLPKETIITGYSFLSSLPYKFYRINSGEIKTNYNCYRGNYGQTDWSHKSTTVGQLTHYEIAVLRDTSEIPFDTEIVLELNLEYRGKPFTYKQRIDLYAGNHIGGTVVEGPLWLTILRVTPPLPSSELNAHLSANAKYYGQSILRKLPTDEMTRILSRYGMNIGSSKLSLLSLVDPVPVGVFGNLLAFRMRIPSMQSIVGDDEDYRWRDVAKSWESWCVRHGIKIGDIQEDLVPVPTGGVFAEAILGRANCAEKLDPSRFWNWQDSPIPIQPPEIAALSAGSRAQPDQLQTAQLSGPVLSPMQSAALPDPSSFAATLNALSQPNLFRDMSASSLVGQLAEQTTNAANQGANAALSAAKDAALATIEAGKEVAIKQEETKQQQDKNKADVDKAFWESYKPKTLTEKLCTDIAKENADSNTDELSGDGDSADDEDEVEPDEFDDDIIDVPPKPPEERKPKPDKPKASVRNVDANIVFRAFFPSMLADMFFDEDSSSFPLFCGNHRTKFDPKASSFCIEIKGQIKLAASVGSLTIASEIVPSITVPKMFWYSRDDAEQVAGKPKWWWQFKASSKDPSPVDSRELKAGDCGSMGTRILPNRANAVYVDIKSAFTPFVNIGEKWVANMLEMLPIGETAIPVFKAVSDKIGSLKANISLAFVSSEKGMVTASAQGTHCGFPSYELFVNDKELYTYDAQKCENLQLAIAGMVQEHVNSRVLTIDAVKK